MTDDQGPFHVDLESSDAAPAALIACWRCGQDYGADQSRCPACLARPRADQAGVGAGRRPPIRDANDVRLSRVIVVFIGLLASSLVGGLAASIGAGADSGPDQTADAALDLRRTLVLEGFDTLLVLAALAWAPRPKPSAAVPGRRRLAVWIAAAPVLALTVAANYGYHRFLIDAFDLDVAADDVLDAFGLSPLVLLALCIQPAIVEELFFRHLALGALRGAMSAPAAVVVSAVMFGVAHIGVPLSIPMLTIVGLVLGCARVAAGGLALPIVMHFTHNFVVIFMISNH